MTEVVIHPRATVGSRLRVWAGLFDAPPSDTLSFRWSLDGQAGQPNPLTSWHLAVDNPASRVQAGVFEFDGVAPNSRHRIQLTAVAGGVAHRSGELLVKSLPEGMPSGIGESFNVLIVSCYSEPTDPAGLAGSVVANLPAIHTPDLTLLMGDQVYLDIPIFTKPTLDPTELTQLFERKYIANWKIADGRTNGFAQVLDAAPAVCIPDDHEYWNNFPRASVMSPITLTGRGRDAWRGVALELFDAFQQDVPNEYSRSLDVEPLTFFFMDNRTFRDSDFGPSMRPADLTAFQTWIEHVIATKRIAVLVTGPSLFQEPKGTLAKTAFDSNLSNYADYGAIMAGLLDLSRAGRPALLLTGDVHYGRIVQAWDRMWPHSKIHEVIASPASLVPMPGFDQLKGLAAMIRRHLGSTDVAPRWPHAVQLKDEFLIHGSQGLDTRLNARTLHPLDDNVGRGDNVAVLSFRRNGFGVDMDVTYFMIPKDDSKTIPRRVDVGTVALRPTV
jgi:hypothetical protein